MGIKLHRGFESRPLRYRRNRLNKRFLARATGGGHRARSPLWAPYGSVLEAIPTWTKQRGSAHFPIFFQGVWEEASGEENAQHEKGRGRWRSDTKALPEPALAILRSLQPLDGSAQPQDEAHVLHTLRQLANADDHTRTPVAALGLSDCMVKWSSSSRRSSPLCGPTPTDGARARRADGRIDAARARGEDRLDLLGAREDDITYSLGWGLSRSEALARAMLGEGLCRTFARTWSMW